MKQIFTFLFLLLITANAVYGQKLLRSSLSSFGAIKYENGTTYRQTIGQPSSTTVFSNENNVLRQGFQQPLSHIQSGSRKEKQCTLYLSPNPTSSNVTLRFAEEIGENQVAIFDMMGKLQFKTVVQSSGYELDISNLSRGIYMVNVISKSGYFCSQKLIVN